MVMVVVVVVVAVVVVVVLVVVVVAMFWAGEVGLDWKDLIGVEIVGETGSLFPPQVPLCFN